MGRRFRAKCLVCPWVSSKLNSGPVFALWDGLRHARKEHPNSYGFVSVAEEVNI